MLRAIGLTKTYAPGPPPLATPALASLDLDVHDGELVFLLGANGAGKTTTLNCFLDFVRPSAGRAEVDGIHVAAEPLAAKRRMAFVPENVVAYPSLSAVQNLRFFARLGGRTPELTNEECERALLRAGLERAAHHRAVRDFSKGMRQKLGLAAAIARDTPNLVLDEPTSGLDPAAATDFMALLAKLRDDGRAILMSTHDIFRARLHADRAALLRAGHLVTVIPRTVLRTHDLESLYLAYMREDCGHGEWVVGPDCRLPTPDSRQSR